MHAPVPNFVLSQLTGLIEFPVRGNEGGNKKPRRDQEEKIAAFYFVHCCNRRIAMLLDILWKL
jgi:hypothetical protein